MLEKYPGGKNGSGVYQKIINQMPPHHTYVEAFLGSGAILRRKRPAVVNIGIDLNPHVISTWRREAPEGLTVINTDAVQWIIDAEEVWQRDTLLYLDPPYLMSTRSTPQQYYLFEMIKEEQHQDLLKVIKYLDCMVMISGYWSELYGDMLGDWRVISFQAMTHGGPATEYLWMNYPEPVELHDYQYLGDDYREREKIRRRVKRWRARLARMDRLERLAMMQAISEQEYNDDVPDGCPIAVDRESAG